MSELWEAAAPRLPPRARGPAGAAGVRDRRAAAGRATRGLRPAAVADLDLLVPACAAAHEEELGIDPLRRDADGFRWRTRAQIEEGRSWLWVEDGVIRFKAEASAWTPGAVQLQQVWVDPAARGRAYATRALADLVRLLLERTPTVCLFVRAENDAAIRLYEPDRDAARAHVPQRALVELRAETRDELGQRADVGFARAEVDEAGAEVVVAVDHRVGDERLAAGPEPFEQPPRSARSSSSCGTSRRRVAEGRDAEAGRARLELRVLLGAGRRAGARAGSRRRSSSRSPARPAWRSASQTLSARNPREFCGPSSK